MEGCFLTGKVHLNTCFSFYPGEQESTTLQHVIKEQGGLRQASTAPSRQLETQVNNGSISLVCHLHTLVNWLNP